MPTRLYTSFMMPSEDSIADNSVQYWVDVEDDYEKVFEQIYPLQQATSSLEARERFWFTKPDGTRFSCMTAQIMGFEELTT